MNQTVYILIPHQFSGSFYLTSMKEKTTTVSYKSNSLKDQAFKDSIKEKSKRPTISTMSSMPSIKTID